MDQAPSSELSKLQQALHSMEFALQLLDETNAPGDIGAHLDMAICRMKESLPQQSRTSHVSDQGNEPGGH